MEPKTLHFRVNDITRNKARPDNAVKACAYRSGQNLRDAKTGKLHRYAAKGGVVRAAIFASGAAPEWMRDDDRKRAWERFGNEVEAAEDGHNKRDSALLGIDWNSAAPRELSLEQSWNKIAVPFARKLNERGLAVAVALHETDASDGGKNPHFHFFVPQRQTDKDGFLKRHMEFTGNPRVIGAAHKKLREEYFALVNDALADAGVTGVYYDPQKQDKIPGKHKGKVAWAMERKAEDRAMDNHLRPALRGLEEKGEVPTFGLGDHWGERMAFLAERAEEREAEEEADRKEPDGSWRDYVTGHREDMDKER